MDTTKLLQEIADLKHRLLMVEDDLLCIRTYVHMNGYDFTKPSGECDEGWTHFNNIEIACDLSTDEALNWKLFSKRNTKTIAK